MECGASIYSNCAGGNRKVQGIYRKILENIINRRRVLNRLVVNLFRRWLSISFISPSIDGSITPINWSFRCVGAFERVGLSSIHQFRWWGRRKVSEEDVLFITLWLFTKKPPLWLTQTGTKKHFSLVCSSIQVLSVLSRGEEGGSRLKNTNCLEHLLEGMGCK